MRKRGLIGRYITKTGGADATEPGPQASVKHDEEKPAVLHGPLVELKQDRPFRLSVMA
jgi:hypothetical protein